MTKLLIEHHPKKRGSQFFNLKSRFFNDPLSRPSLEEPVAGDVDYEIVFMTLLEVEIKQLVRQFVRGSDPTIKL